MRPLLGRIACPTLVLCGELDMVAGPARARVIAERVPGAELVVLPGSGHFMALEAPAELRDAVLGFAA